MQGRARAIIAFGANEGDPQSAIRNALDRVRRRFELLKVSSIYRTSPVGGPSGQSDYLNGVAIVSVDLTPLDTMKKLLEIETELGRVRREKWGPRTIDLDLLDYDGVVMNEADLVLPHPRLHERAFVMFPLAEVAPEWRHPTIGATAVELRDRLDSNEKAGIRSSEAFHE